MNAIALLMLMTVSGAQDVAPDSTLYFVTADWCTYCHEMKPTVDRLIAEGYPVQVVNQDRNQQLSSQLGVQGLPGFVMVRNQQVVGRLEGRTTYSRLVKMFPSAGKVAPQPVVREPYQQAIPSVVAGSTSPTTIIRGQSPEPRSINNQLVSNTSVSNGRTLAMQASVKLKVSDADGYSTGSGTIIHMHQGEALALTCGHLFRDSQGQGSIEVTLFAPGSPGPVSGRLISYDLERDVALVSLKPNTTVQPVPLGGDAISVQVGQTAFSIGCNQGQPATIMESRINSINRYEGPANVQAAGVPIYGRSGGGLFTSDGTLVGVCTGADHEDQEGFYEALPTIYEELNKMKIAHLFNQAPNTQLASHTAPQATTNLQPISVAPSRVIEQPAAQQNLPVTNSTQLSPAEMELLNYLRSHGNDTEVLLLLKSKTDPSVRPVVFTLPSNPSPELLREMMATQQRPIGNESGVTLRGQSR
ncbi:MAG: hypothetical protein COA78_05840 [Blastopirellula sp.]|nr:MAG: hypothetical protein COA78_05840 [Blastopirellula sp.]